MRRTARAVTAAALLGVSAAAGCGPQTAGQGGPAAAKPQEAAAIAATGTKKVEYDGYVINVPAGWPVYLLSGQPTRCVRYDRHAVYLGTPGPDQQCPAHLVGRTDTVQIDGGEGQAVVHQRGVALASVPGSSAHRGMIVRDAQGREVALTIERPRLSIVATYANDPAVVEWIISSVHGAGSAPAGPLAPGASLPRLALAAENVAPGRAVREDTARAVAAGVVAAGVVAAGVVAAGTEGARARRARRPLAGFDTCTAPSIPAMRAWRPYYEAIGIYIGGVNRACDTGNLSARWVRRVKGMGWSLIPAYVGRQPPCDPFSVKIKPRWAASEGAAAANDAVILARGLRLHRHAPIYFDMEAYNSASRKCRTAVLTFLDAWTRRLRARGYVPGVYASAASGARNLGGTARIAGHRLARPQSIWFALWDGHVNLRGQPYLRPSWWPRGRRIKQFRSNRWQKHGGFRLDIDRDEVFGAVY